MGHTELRALPGQPLLERTARMQSLQRRLSPHMLGPRLPSRAAESSIASSGSQPMARECRAHAATAAPELVRTSRPQSYSVVLPRPQQQGPNERESSVTSRQLRLHPQLSQQQQRQHQPLHHQQEQQQVDVSQQWLQKQSQQQRQQQALLQLVSQCNSWQSLFQVVQQHQHMLMPHHTDAVLQRLVALAPSSQTLSMLERQRIATVVATLAALLLEQLPATTGAQLFSSVQSLTVLGHRPSPEWASAMLARAQQQLNHCSFAELTTFIAAAAAWRDALAPASAAEPAVASTSAPSIQGGRGSVAVPTLVTRFLSVSERQLTSRGARIIAGQLENIALSLSALGARPSPSWLYLYVRQLGSVMAQLPPSSLVTIASILAQWGCRLPDHVASQLERQVGAHLAALRPNELVTALNVLAQLRHKPSNNWIDAVLGRAMISSTHLNSRAVVGLMAAAAALQYELPPEWLDLLLMQARHALHALSGAEVIGLIDAVSAHHHRPGPGFMAAYMEQAGRHLPGLSLAELTALIAGLADVAYRPPPQWMAGYVRAVLQTAPAPHDYGVFMKLLAALRKLQYSPPGDVMHGMEAQVDQLALGLPYQQIQALRGALAELQYEAYAAAAAADAAEAEATGEGEEAAGAAATASSSDDMEAQELLLLAGSGDDTRDSEDDAAELWEVGSDIDEEYEDSSSSDPDAAMVALQMLS